ncbi:hypothetical protein L602_002200000730 [Cupriavidus gilardii J11]|uniref:Uncharacterized protein n=1 Tax=Cupriavidus gilardii J11 TaxID=936133 RepID=A0A562BL96_9BURK|nr:hypothetical protein L602_002200000730 [Cupriavidus gilardii J11]
MAVTQRIGLDGAIERRQRDALGIRRAIALLGQRHRAFPHLLREYRGLGDIVHQAPVLGPLAPHALGGGTEQVGQIMAHMALVGNAREAAGPRQHAQQRHFGQADRRRTVVDQDDLVAGERQLVSAAGACAVDRGDELQAAVARRVLDAIAGLVGELAEVDLPRMAADTEHEDVGARAEHLVAGAGHHHAAHLGMLEADAVQRVVQLDIDTQVIAVQFQLVAGAQPSVLVDIEQQGSNGAIELEPQVPVAGRIGLVVDGGVLRHGSVSSAKGHDIASRRLTVPSIIVHRCYARQALLCMLISVRRPWHRAGLQRGRIPKLRRRSGFGT